MSNNKEIRKLNVYIILISSLLIANPFIIFLLTNSYLVSITILLTVTIITLTLYYLESNPKWILVITLNIFLMISIFVHFEVIFRYAFTEFIINDIYDYKYTYYLNKSYLYENFIDKEYNIIYATNNQGYRISANTEPDIEINKCDWLFVGDSYTQGAQVQYEELYTSQLYKEFPDKIIINAGISGFGIKEEYYYLKDNIHKLNPNIVFLQLCNFNDFMNIEDNYSLNLISIIMHESDLFRYLLYGFKYKSPGELPLGRWTEPFYKNEKDNIDYNVFYKVMSEKKGKDIKDFNKYLSKIKSLLDSNNIKLIVMLIPTKEQLYYKYFTEVINGYNIDVNEVDMTIPNKIVKNICDSLFINLIDYYSYYPQYKNQVFFDYDEHLNAYGHKVTSDIISNYITGKLNIKKEFDIIGSSTDGNRYPSLIKDTSLILYQSIREDNYEIFTYDTLSGDITRITYNNVDEIHPTSCSDNKIALTQGRQGTMKTDVIIMDYDGYNRQLITNDINTYGAIPNYSRSCTLLVFSTWNYNRKNDNYSNPYISLVNLNTMHKFDIKGEHIEYWRPVISNNDSLITYIAKNDNNYDIFEYDIVLNKERQLTKTPFDEWDPFVLSDNNFIIYSSYKNNNWDIYVLNKTNMKVSQITNSKGNEWDPFYVENSDILLFAGEMGFMNGIFIKNIKIGNK